MMVTMFHNLWDRHTPDSLPRKFGKHSLDGHPYIGKTGREFPPGDHPYHYSIDPTEEGFDKEGYNRARMQAGLLEGWLLSLPPHLAFDNPVDEKAREMYLVDDIYAADSGARYTSEFTENGERDDIFISNTHWSWLESLLHMGFTYNVPGEGGKPAEDLPSFSDIPPEGHRLSGEAGHGLSFGAGEGFAGILNTLLGGAEAFDERWGEEVEGKSIWEVLEGQEQDKFMAAYGRPPKVDGKTVVGDYGRGAELSSFDKAWKSYQGFLGHSEV